MSVPKVIFCSMMALLTASCSAWLHLPALEELASTTPTPPTVQFQTSVQSASETVGTATITVSLNTAATTDIVVPFTVSGSATGGGADYTLAISSVTILAGQLSATITVSIVNDSSVESPETIIVTLGSVSGATLGSTTSHTITIDTTCDPALTGSYGGGAGTLTEPFTICSLSQWDHFGSDTANWNKVFRLENDLDFTGVPFASFKMIGNSTTAFTGTFRGNSRTIKNITLAAGSNRAGLFLKTDGTVAISDLTLSNISLTSTGRVASLVVEHGNTGSLTLTGITANTIAFPTVAGLSGGLVGTVGGDFIADQITISGFSANGPGTYVAGLVSQCLANCTVTNITGTNISQSGSGGGDYAAGLIGASGVGGNLVLADINLTTVETYGLYSGGVVARIGGNATFDRVHVAQGDLSATLSAGGLFFEYSAFVPYSLIIQDSSYQGDIYGGSGIGGLGHWFAGSVTIRRSFVKGNLTTWSGTASGLINQPGMETGHNVLIEDSYVVGVLNSTAGHTGYVRGLLNSAGDSPLTLRRSYFSGTLVGGVGGKSCILSTTATVGGVTVSDVTYDNTLCTFNQSNSGAITGVTARATGALQTATPFTNWNPAVWTFTSGQNPKLAWEP